MNILIPFTILIFSWSIDSTDPAVQRLIQYIFVAIHALALAMFLYIVVKIWRTGGRSRLQVKDPYTGEMETKEEWDYDATKLRELFFTKIGLSAATSLFIASRFGMPFPLLLQCLNNPKAIYDSEVFQIYVLGKPAVGELQRPWKDSGMVPEWVKAMWAQGSEDSEAFVAKHTGSGPAKRK